MASKLNGVLDNIAKVKELINGAAMSTDVYSWNYNVNMDTVTDKLNEALALVSKIEDSLNEASCEFSE